MLNEPQLLIPVAAPPRWLHLRRSARSRLVLGGSLAPLVAAGLAWQWSWLVAIGVAPLLLSAAPCIVMCALGLCMTSWADVHATRRGRLARWIGRHRL
jgi:hypothetical protein